jgi:crotonobetainyl-CoA:carnitine CoA-transferase CaiB-like acyl-CoA transferase
MNQQPLAGITVLDFGQVYNGPYCGFLLTQAGARVIKVESLIGETIRPKKNKDVSFFPFNNLNFNKECIAIDLKKAPGREIVRALSKKVDVVLQNFAPGTMEKFGLGSTDLIAENPRLIYAMGTGYGSSEGPYRDFLGMDITLQAMSGAMSVTGEEDGPPLKTPAAYIDFMAGVHLYGGIVTALFARAASGRGTVVDISMQDCAFPTLSTAIGSFYSEGEELPRAGSRHPAKTVSPYNVYKAKDGHVAIICIREGHWKKICDAMEKPELKEDPRFSGAKARGENIDEVDHVVTEWTSQLKREEIFKIAQECGVICAPVQTISESVNDVHMLSRGSLKKKTYSELGDVSFFQTPIRFQNIDPPELKEVRQLGEDTNSVLSEFLSFDTERLNYLKTEGVIV